MVERLDWKAAVIAGLIAGLVFLILEMLLVATLAGQSPWGPPRMIAAMALGQEVLPPPASFDVGIVVVALVIHFALSVILAFMFGWAVSNWRMNMPIALLSGVVFGLAVYLIDFYLFTTIWPWFAEARNAITVFAHAMFGLTLGAVYQPMAGRRWRAAPPTRPAG